MVKHVVLWKFKEEFAEAEKADAFAIIKSKIEGLKGIIEEIVDVKVSRSINPEEDCDFVIQVTFRSLEDCRAYATHPNHVEAARFIKGVISHRYAIDFEI